MPPSEVDGRGSSKTSSGGGDVRILGVDPGIERTGWGVVDVVGRDFIPVDYGCIMTSKELNLPERLLAIHGSLSSVMQKHSPDVLAVEQVFFAKNAKSAIDVGHARGVSLLLAASQGVPVEEVTPLQVKSTVVGYGNATKDQVGKMVTSLLRLQKIPRPDDVCDALGVAVAAATKRSFAARLVGAGPESTRGRGK